MTALTVGLVGCGSQKLQRPSPARDLYVGDLFRKSSAYAERTCDRWYVLSAKHGLVHPDQVLEPYDVTFGGKHERDAGPIWDWAERVAQQLREELAGHRVWLVALCGDQYRTVLQRLPEWPHEIPMKGLGIGQQKAWLKARLQEVA